MPVLPALSDNKVLRYFNFIVLYIAQGIPEGMALFGIPAWMAMNGKTAGEIGAFVAAFGLPWSFKLVVAPLMDRFTYLPMGRRRPWVLFGQVCLILSFVAMAFVPDPLNNMWLLCACAFAVGCSGAFQDVATDGMAIDVVPEDQQARANGFMWGAKIMGTSASLAAGSWLLNEFGYKPAILTLSFFIFLIMLAPLFLRERPGEKLLPWSSGSPSSVAVNMQLTSWKIILRSIFKVITLRNSLILAATLFISQAGFNFLATLLPVFTVQSLGWTDQEYSRTFAMGSFIGGIGGMLIGGILIDRFGKKLMMNVYYFLLVLFTLLFVYFKVYWSSSWFIGGFMMAYQLIYVFTCIGLFAIAMQCCMKKVSATQFTIFMTIGNLGRIAGARLIGPVKEHFSWEYTILACSIILLTAGVVLSFLNIKTQLKNISFLEEEKLTTVKISV